MRSTTARGWKRVHHPVEIQGALRAADHRRHCVPAVKQTGPPAREQRGRGVAGAAAAASAGQTVLARLQRAAPTGAGGLPRKYHPRAPLTLPHQQRPQTGAPARVRGAGAGGEGGRTGWESAPASSSSGGGEVTCARRARAVRRRLAARAGREHGSTWPSAATAHGTPAGAHQDRRAARAAPPPARCSSRPCARAVPALARCPGLPASGPLRWCSATAPCLVWIAPWWLPHACCRTKVESTFVPTVWNSNRRVGFETGHSGLWCLTA